MGGPIIHTYGYICRTLVSVKGGAGLIMQGEIIIHSLRCMCNNNCHTSSRPSGHMRTDRESLKDIEKSLISLIYKLEYPNIMIVLYMGIMYISCDSIFATSYLKGTNTKCATFSPFCIIKIILRVLVSV